MSALARALLEDLSPEELAELARRLAPYLVEPNRSEDHWLTTREAARYLGVGLSELQRKAACGEVKSEQNVPNGKRYFRASDLDAWREGR
jgi:excisionase family DNA binding protein